MPAAIAAAREATGKPVIVYPNSGEAWDARRRAWTGQSRFSAGLPRQWIAAGARIAGGCCRVRPADIAVIAGAATGPPCARRLRLTCPAGGGAAPGRLASSAHISIRFKYNQRQCARRFEQALITPRDESWPDLSEPIDAEYERFIFGGPFGSSAQIVH